MDIADKLRTINSKLAPGHLLFSPEWLVLGVNNICNLHCKMCDVGTKSATVFSENLVGTNPVNMPIELFRRIVDQSVKYFPKVKLGFAFTEPLVYPHLEETLAYAQQNKLHTSVTTNALNLKQRAKALSETGCAELFISLDGPEEIHNYIRGHKSSFQRAVAGIEELATFDRRPSISIFCAITEWNVGHLKRFLSFFKNYPISQVGFVHNNFTSPDTANSHNALFGQLYRATVSNSDESDVGNIDLKLLWEEISNMKRAAYPFKVSFSPEFKSFEELEVFYRKPDIMIGSSCRDVFRNVMIKSDGSVIPAHGRCYNLTVGNVYDQSLPEIWKSRVFSKFRMDIIRQGGFLPACSRCCSAFEK